MLLELNVKDIALIRKAAVRFDRGLNIMTGETGTGKSVIIDSAMLALGGKARNDLIRSGAESAYIELVFSVEDPERLDKLKELDIYPEDGLLVISRKLLPGRSVSRINDETVTLSRLREVTSLLIDIYGQNEYHTLMDRKAHLRILDDFLGAAAQKERRSAAEAYENWISAEKLLASFDLDEKERLREADLAAYEIQEIEAAGLKEAEEEELSQRYRKLNNARSILENANDAYRALQNCDTGRAVNGIAHAMRYDEEGLRGIYEELMDVQSVLEAALGDIRSYVDELDMDEGELEETERRLDLIRSLEAKYGGSIAEILEYKARKEERLRKLEAYEEEKQRAAAALEKAQKELGKACAALSAKRREGAAQLCAKILGELKDLGFEKAVLEMQFVQKAPSADGYDDVCFITSLNPGEKVKPLNEVASGGELSRVMLAIKTVMAATDDIPTLIFDEIDTGISGRTAQKVAEKLDLIAGRHQVICVSHLPQIAAMADTHYVIQKTEEEGRNITSIERLDSEGEIQELARLLSGESITRAVYENACELKAQAQKGKKERRLL